MWPIVSPILTLVSKPNLVCSTISLSIFIVSFLKNKIVVEPPNLKYPFSSPFFTLFSGEYVWSIVPTQVAPTSTWRISPKLSELKIDHSLLFLQKSSDTLLRAIGLTE